MAQLRALPVKIVMSNNGIGGGEKGRVVNVVYEETDMEDRTNLYTSLEWLTVLFAVPLQLPRTWTDMEPCGGPITTSTKYHGGVRLQCLAGRNGPIDTIDWASTRSDMTHAYVVHFLTPSRQHAKMHCWHSYERGNRKRKCLEWYRHLLHAYAYAYH